MPYGSVQNRADVKPAFETKQVSGGKKGEIIERARMEKLPAGWKQY